MHIVAINGSYRDDGLTDHLVASATRELAEAGASIDVVTLRDCPIEFCLNCRECMREPGTKPGHCVLEDGMQHIINRMEQADAFIFASPTNFSTVTALFKRFMERLAPYGYWPASQAAPSFRKESLPPKKAMLIGSGSAPGLPGRYVFNTLRSLKVAANTINAKPVSTLFVGFSDYRGEHGESPALERKIRRKAMKLLQ